PATGKISAEPVESGIRLKSGDRDLGTLSWDVYLQPIDRVPTDEQAAQTKRDFDKTCPPLPLKFAEAKRTPHFNLYSADASKNGINLKVTLEVYPSGFVDVRA